MLSYVIKMISKAEEKDAPQLEALITKEFAYKGLTKDRIAQRLRRPEIIVFKKTVAGEIVGFVDLEAQGETLFLNALSTHEGHREKGYGKELLEHAIGYAQKNGFARLELLVKKGNEAAKKLYAKLGFGFVKYHRKIVDNSVVEVWEKTLRETTRFAT